MKANLIQKAKDFCQALREAGYEVDSDIKLSQDELLITAKPVPIE